MGLFDNVTFRTFDYDGFKNALFQLAKNKPGFQDWTDTLESNQGVVFIEWLAFIAANLSYLQNFHARQGFVPTVTESKNLAKLAKQYDYQIPNNTAASVDVTISQDGGAAFQFDVIIPAGTQILTSGTTPIIFETISDLTIPAGAFSGTVGSLNQETKSDNDTADGSADFKTTMNYGPYVEGSMVVTVDNVAWAEVRNFLDSGSADEHFRIEVSSESVVTVVFGDDNNGKIPPLNSSIVYTYKVGGGTIGNISPGAIASIPGTFFDVNGNIVSLLVTNTNPGEGGGDREAVRVTKLRLPASIAAKDITIDYEDFQTNITNVPGVARVSVRTVNDDPNIPENLVMCFILPTASDVLSDALSQQIESAMESNPRPLTQSMYLVGPQFVTIDMDVRDLLVNPEEDDGTGAHASGTITVNDNTFNAGDAVIVNGVTFTYNVDWLSGVDVDATALNIKVAIEASNNPLLQDIEATVLNNVVTVSARTTGIHGNEYTLAEIDAGNDNFTISNPNFEQGEDSTIQGNIRAAVDAFFGRTNIDENGKYTVEFGGTVYRNRLICVVQDVFGVKAFNLLTPVGDTVLDIGQFPKYTLKFTTS